MNQICIFYAHWFLDKSINKQNRLKYIITAWKLFNPEA